VTPKPASASSLPLPFSWIRSGRLAIGACPRGPGHWQALEASGIQRVFSCCHPSEAPWAPPPHWSARQRPLPDHRSPEPLSEALLRQAIAELEELQALGQGGLYLHCWAGQERSPLMAVALLCRSEGLALLDALALVRRCHPQAQPILAQLALLEQVLG
jgi:hypothetical protein